MPKVVALGKKKGTGHSLLFDSALADPVMRQNAYEERLLTRRTEVIEREKQQTLRKLDFYRNKFLMRNFSVIIHQKKLQQSSLSKSFKKTSLQDEKKPIKLRSSSPYTWSRMNSEADKLAIRKTVSEPIFPALQENMDDILNGYRTPRLPEQSGIASFKTSLEVKRNFQSSSKKVKDTESDEASWSSVSKCSDSVNQTQRQKFNVDDCAVEEARIPKASSKVKFSKNILMRNCKHTNQLDRLEQLLGRAKLSNVETSMGNFVLKDRAGEGVKGVKDDLNKGLEIHMESAEPLRQGNDMYILSDIKMRERQEAQRIRVMRTVLLAYDMILNERFQRISMA